VDQGNELLSNPSQLVVVWPHVKLARWFDRKANETMNGDNKMDEFENNLSDDWVFNGSIKDIESFWLNSASRWYPETFVNRDENGEMWCRITNVICERHKMLPLFCRDGGMRHISCTSGETLHVCEAVRREEIKPLACCTHLSRGLAPR